MTRIGCFKFAPWIRLVLAAFSLLLCSTRSARADQLSEDLAGLASADASDVSAAIIKAADRADPRALPALHALDEGKLRFDAIKHLLIKADNGSLSDALTGAPASAQGKLEEPASDNQVRRALSPALASLSLSAPDAKVRLAAAHELGRPSDEIVPVLRKVLNKETNADVKVALALALAPADMISDKPADRIRALEAIRQASDATFKSDVERLLTRGEDGKFVEPDPSVRAAAKAAVSAIETRQFLINSVANTFYGLSLGSVLILCALGLAITFGLMRVINMAHGEMMMIGAYTSFVVQNFFLAHLASARDSARHLGHLAAPDPNRAADLRGAERDRRQSVLALRRRGDLARGRADV
jgi:urea transport system permease protein